MDGWLQVVGGVLIAAITTAGTLAAKRQKRSKRNGLPGNESEAREMAPSAPLMKQNAGELQSLRDELKQQADELALRTAAELADLKKRVSTQEGERELDAQHIDALEQHIWLQKPPPPPSRLRAQRSEA